MGTKNNPGKFDCYSKAEPDEPIFTLLGRDPLAPELVEEWANLRALDGGSMIKIKEARDCAEAMRKWQRENCAPTAKK